MNISDQFSFQESKCLQETDRHITPSNVHIACLEEFLLLVLMSWKSAPVQCQQWILQGNQPNQVTNLSKYNLFSKSLNTPCLTKKTPTKEVNTLVELQDNINNNKYGPWWFKSLFKAIDYDCCLVDWSYKTEQTLKCMQNNKNQAIKGRDNAIQDRDNAIQEKENTIQEYSNVQELLSSAQLKVERLFCENKILTSHLPSQQHENQGCLRSRWWISLISCLPFCGLTFFRKKPHHRKYWNQSYLCVWHLCSQWCSCSCSHICLHQQNWSHSCSQVDQQDWLHGWDDLLMHIIYQAYGMDPSKKLTGKNIHDYNLWAHSIWKKLKVDKILFPANSDKTDYVLLQMKAPIWNKINI